MTSHPASDSSQTPSGMRWALADPYPRSARICASASWRGGARKPAPPRRAHRTADFEVAPRHGHDHDVVRIPDPRRHDDLHHILPSGGVDSAVPL
eukprot:scaffold2705_cov109-Isochrysis_galbana.AAC.5